VAERCAGSNPRPRGIRHSTDGVRYPKARPKPHATSTLPWRGGTPAPQCLLSSCFVGAAPSLGLHGSGIWSNGRGPRSIPRAAAGYSTPARLAIRGLPPQRVAQRPTPRPNCSCSRMPSRRGACFACAFTRPFAMSVPGLQSNESGELLQRSGRPCGGGCAIF
jgi:hypothetical protein